MEIIAASFLVAIVHSQPTQHREWFTEQRGDCIRESIFPDVGTYDEHTTEGIVAWHQPTGDASLADVGHIKILNATIVCEAPGLKKNTVSSLSLVVHWECISPGWGCSGPTGEVMQFTGQIAVDCVVRNRNDPESVAWYPPRSVGSGFNLVGPLHPRVPAPGPCGLCYDADTVPAHLYPDTYNDPVTLCTSMSIM